jgi:hypothetical protein
VSRVEIKNLLRSLQDSYLRAALGSREMTPTEALEVALCQTPLDLATIEAVGLTVYRLKCQGEWRNTGLGHTKLKFLKKYPFTLKQDRILKKHQLVKPFKIRIPNRQEWHMPHKIMDPIVDLRFTDGWEYMTALVQVFLDPYITTGKANLWAAFPWCFLLN